MKRIEKQSSRRGQISQAFLAPLLLSLGRVRQVYSINTAENVEFLNAYYFPDRQYGMLYSGISPVNSFRVVLNQYFGGQYELLPDRQSHSKWSFPFEFFEMTDLPLP